MNPSKTKGTAFESAIVRYLVENGHPHAERRALAGAADRGDIAGLPGVMIEAKSVKTITLASIMDEVVEQTANCGDNVIGVAWIKRRNKGIERSYVVMEPATFLALLDE